jgi:Rps23 Pro-64 3,4-dihydroxylase Tpa1-like proline 4-hydroxylase
MIICDKPKSFPYLVIRDFYTNEEQKSIWQELEFLTTSSKLDPPNLTGQKDPSMKHNHGVFIDNIYTDRKYSNILQINRKLFSPEVTKAYESLHYTNRYKSITNLDTTLVSYYENAGYYKPHHDVAVVTAISWHFRQPKAFSGGNLIFTDFNEIIEIEDNMLVMFPSCAMHEVTSIAMESYYPEMSGYGRYAISNFSQISNK